MGFKDSAATGTWAGFRWEAAAVVADKSVAPLSPADGDVTSSLAVPLSFAVDNTSGANSDVQVQVATDAAFASVVASTTLTNQTNGTKNYQPTGLSASVRYYWRARAADTGTTGWGPWSTVWSFIVNVDSGRAFGYSYENVGGTPTPYAGGIEYVTANYGILTTLYAGVIEYVMENVGHEITTDFDAVEYVYEGDVSTNTPIPHIWFLLPGAGRPGDGVDIVGLGFGDLQTTYSGIVERYDDVTETWISVGAVAWQTFPPGANAYTALRHIDPTLGEIDMQHTVISIVVPMDAVEPGFPLRVRTNGP